MSTVGESFFLVIEGLDGSGKTTIARQLARRLQRLDYKVYLTFEPHDASAAGLFIRQVLNGKLVIPPRVLALAFALNRADHSHRVIEPFLDRSGHRLVICDRYYLSSLVYQSSDEVSMKQILALNNGVRQPDLIIFLDANTNTCFRRMRLRAAISEEKRDRELFEKHLDKTRAKYRQAMAFLRKQGVRIERVDANSDSIVDIIDDIVRRLADYGPAWLKPQLPLFELEMEEELDAFSLNGDFNGQERIAELIRQYGLTVLEHSAGEGSTFEEIMKGKVGDTIWKMRLDDLGILFLAYLQKSGYRVVDRIPWTDISAYELEAALPLNIKQRGTALILATQYGHDTITSKIQNEKLAAMSDFMIVLDPSTSKLATSYSRDLIRYSGYSSLSPNTLILGRDDIAQMVLSELVASHEHGDSLIISNVSEASG